MVRRIDHGPWHRGTALDEAKKAKPHLEFNRLPRDSPQPNPSERFWKIGRRRATPNRLFDTLADRKQSIRANHRSFQTVRARLLTRINGRKKKSAT